MEYNKRVIKILSAEDDLVCKSDSELDDKIRS